MLANGMYKGLVPTLPKNALIPHMDSSAVPSANVVTGTYNLDVI
jgi:hypothetical protein